MWDLTLPGYNYLGPFNKLNKGPPRSYNDLIAAIHDDHYDDIQNEGGNPYTMYNDADENAFERFSMYIS